MFLSKREYFNSQVYSKYKFIKKEVIPLTLVYILINLIFKIIEFKNSHFIFKFNVIFILLLSSLCILFSMIINSHIRYDIYKNVNNKLSKFLYFFYNFICIFLFFLGGLVLQFDTNPKKTIILIITSFLLSFIYSVFISYIAYKIWNKNFKFIKNSFLNKEINDIL